MSSGDPGHTQVAELRQATARLAHDLRECGGIVRLRTYGRRGRDDGLSCRLRSHHDRSPRLGSRARHRGAPPHHVTDASPFRKRVPVDRSSRDPEHMSDQARALKQAGGWAPLGRARLQGAAAGSNRAIGTQTLWCRAATAAPCFWPRGRPTAVSIDVLPVVAEVRIKRTRPT